MSRDRRPRFDMIPLGDPRRKALAEAYNGTHRRVQKPPASLDKPAATSTEIAAKEVGARLAEVGVFGRDGKPLSARAVRGRIQRRSDPVFAELASARNPDTGKFDSARVEGIVNRIKAHLEERRREYDSAKAEIEASRTAEARAPSDAYERLANEAFDLHG